MMMMVSGALGAAAVDGGHLGGEVHLVGHLEVRAVGQGVLRGRMLGPR